MPARAAYMRHFFATPLLIEFTIAFIFRPCLLHARYDDAILPMMMSYAALLPLPRLMLMRHCCLITSPTSRHAAAAFIAADAMAR